VLLTSVLTSKELTVGVISGLLQHAERDKAGENLLEVYLFKLKQRGVTEKEMSHLTSILLRKAKQVSLKGFFMDVCGTGGDKSNSFNISTTTAFVLAGGGVPVLKHGNRSVSSQCGSSDLMESLGVSLKKAGNNYRKSLEFSRMGYLHAPFFHPFFGKVAPLRKRIGEPTLFNFLGPLLHPGSPKVQLTGVSDEQAFKQYPHWLRAGRRKKAIVLRGEGGFDEATPFGDTQLYELKNGKISFHTVRSRDFHFSARNRKELEVRGRGENRSVFLGILSGKEKGPKREAVLLNAGFGFYLSGRSAKLREGIEMAGSIIDSGAAQQTFDRFRRSCS